MMFIVPAIEVQCSLFIERKEETNLLSGIAKISRFEPTT
jgi:hypothetical protein